uniref:Proprotein convertase P-domain-containing protein n=1 Tax=Candidatus Kentrum sp. LPFa TaxID=2126335 RepID=A0A450VVE3_9GAMM|nr:MAG: Proprotein convertase P-domain-containing protein [Candidatus Kentron sp. LPFa]
MSVLLGNVELFPQGDGPDIQLKVFGDEFYGRYETPAGHTVAYDPKKEKYCYAMLEAGHLVSSGIPTDQPAPDGRRDLERNQRSGGDEGDFFKARSGLALSHNTAPHSRAWGGMDSGLKISDISAPGDTIRFTVGDSRDPDDPTDTPHGSIRVKKPDARDSRDDWRRLYTIRGLEGKPMAGNWTLKVADVASGDIGVLDSWKLIVGYTS